MWSIRIVLLFIILTSGVLCAERRNVSLNEANNSSSDNQSNNVSKKIMVRFKPGTDVRTIKNIKDKYGLVTVKVMNTPGLYLMETDGANPAESIIIELKKHSEVIYAEPDYRYKKDSK